MSNSKESLFGRFRCTYCKALIPWKINNEDLGLAPGEEVKLGDVYPYHKCYCGWGKFVVCEGEGSEVLEEKEPTTEMREQVEKARYLKIPTDSIAPNPFQPRRFFDAEALRSLADSITQIGLLEDILVRPKGEGYEIVLGERRWRAAVLAGIESISAKVVELDDEQIKHISLIENIQREDLTGVEEAFAFKSYLDSGIQQKEVGQRLGRMGDRVAEKLKLLSSHYYVEYQEQRVKELTDEIEKLRESLRNSRDSNYDAKIIKEKELIDYLNRGYDIVLTLGEDRIVVRRKVPWASADLG